jgi:GNAT superfamily N-acetyltransferase
MITKKRSGPLLKLVYYKGTYRLKEVGVLYGFYEVSNKPMEFHVTNMFVEKDWRNQGIATALLQRLVTELRKNNVKRVTLDDCSDTGRCYTKFGFSYINQGEPEMELLL